MNSPIAPGDSINLADYFSGLRRYRTFIVVVTVLCGAAGATTALMRHRPYTASVTLGVTLAKYTTEQDRFVRSVPTAASFRPFIESRGTALAVIHDLGLDKPPYDLDASVFLSQVLSLEEVRASTLLKLTASFSDAERAAAIAQRVAERAVALSQKVSSDESARARDFISAQVAVAKKRLDQAEADYAAAQEHAQSEAFKKNYAEQSKVNQLRIQRDVAERTYKDIASRFELVQLRVGARSAQLEIVDPAVVPDAPEPRHLVRDVLFGTLVGLTASILIAIVSQALRAAAGHEIGRSAG